MVLSSKKKYYQNNKEKIKAKVREYREKNIKKVQAMNKAYKSKIKRISLEQYTG